MKRSLKGSLPLEGYVVRGRPGVSWVWELAAFGGTWLRPLMMEDTGPSLFS